MVNRIFFMKTFGMQSNGEMKNKIRTHTPRIYRRKTINSTEQLPISNWILMKTICDVFPIRLLCIGCVSDNIIMLVKSLKS